MQISLSKTDFQTQSAFSILPLVCNLTYGQELADHQLPIPIILYVIGEALPDTSLHAPAAVDRMASDLFWLNLALLCVCGGGIITNVLSAVVFVMGRNSIPGARILLGLAIADGGLLFVIGCDSGVTCWSSGNADFQNYQAPWLTAILDTFRDPIFQGVGQGFYTAGIYLVLALAAGRYIAVYKPHLATKWNSSKHQRLVVLGIFTVALIGALPNLFEERLIQSTIWENQIEQAEKPRHHPGTFTDSTLIPGLVFEHTEKQSTLQPSEANSTEAELPKSDLNLYVLIYDYIFNMFLHYLIPLPCLLFMNICFFRGLRRFQNRRKRLTQTQTTDFTSTKHARVILNVTVILGIFLLCQVASLALWIHRYCVGYADSKLDSSGKGLHFRVPLLFMAVNSATNFWVYLSFLREFQQASVRLLVCACCHCESC